MPTDSDFNPFRDPPTHRRATVPVSSRLTPGSDYVIFDGVEWQVGDCWYDPEIGKTMLHSLWPGWVLSTPGAWMAEVFTRTDKAPR